MRRTIRASLLASALALGAIAAIASPVFAAEVSDSSIGFNGFQRQLAGQGDWFYSDRWGMVWQPYAADADWRPYTRGHWVNTYEYGWLWASDERFGDIAYHYGRWVNDPDDGWLWLPGYVWSPAWVVWRASGDYTGWMPMPPDRRFLSGDEFGGNVEDGGGRPGVNVSIGFNDWNDTNDFYGYGRWYGGAYSQDRFAGLWTFVPVQHFADREYWRYAPRRGEIVDVVRRSRNTTNYTIVNNYIVNRSVDVKVVYRDRREPIRYVRAAEVIRQPSLVARIDLGRNVGLRMRIEMPRGLGVANSAPKPTRAQVEALTPAGKDKGDNAGGPRKPRPHLLDRTAAEVVARPDGSKPAALTAADVAKAKSAEPAAPVGAKTEVKAGAGADQTAVKTKADASGTATTANPMTPPDNGKERKRKPRPDATPDTGTAAPATTTSTTATTPDASNAQDTKVDRAKKRVKPNTTDDNSATPSPSPDATAPAHPHKDRTPDTSNATAPPTSLAPDEERAAKRRANAAASATPPASTPAANTTGNDQTPDKPKKHKPKPDADTPPQ